MSFSGEEQTMTEPSTDYDSPWKEMLERYFEEFMQFFFPQIHAEIEWDVSCIFLDKELQQVARDAELGRRFVDKLVRVVRKPGKEIWVLVHVEVQGQFDDAFDKRMYVYNYRLFDRYDRPVCSLAVLADDRENWRPDRFGYNIWGCEASLKFPTVKLLDYEDRVAELEESTNPFAIVVLAHLKTRATRNNPDSRFTWKVKLYQLLYARGYTREDILELTRFLDWIMTLPAYLEQRFTEAMTQLEEEQKMRYVASYERIWAEQGRQQGLQKGLKQGLQEGLQSGIRQGQLDKSRENIARILRVRFEKPPAALFEALQRVDDLMLLDELLTKAVLVGSLEEFQTIAGQWLPLPLPPMNAELRG